MNKISDVKALLSSFFGTISLDQIEQARAITGVGCLPRGTLSHLLDDQSYSLEDLVTLLLADTLVRQEDLKQKSERLAELETLCSYQQRAIDDIADQSLKLRALIANLDPDQAPLSSFDVLQSIAQKVEHRAG